MKEKIGYNIFQPSKWHTLGRELSVKNIAVSFFLLVYFRFLKLKNSIVSNAFDEINHFDISVCILLSLMNDLLHHNIPKFVAFR
jgi:hypothetical protein